MALGTVKPEFLGVDIVAAVTGSAGQGEFNRIDHGSLMAGQTIQTGVGAIQGEVGLGAVIELPDQPVIRVVTETAIRA